MDHSLAVTKTLPGIKFFMSVGTMVSEFNDKKKKEMGKLFVVTILAI